LRESAITDRLKVSARLSSLGRKAGQSLRGCHRHEASASRRDYPELVESRGDARFPVVHVAEMLFRMMRWKCLFIDCRCRRHSSGKNHNTTMIAALLEGGGLDSTVINAAII